MIDSHARILATQGRPLIDGCGRRIDHLRLSLTDRCNLACRYCAVAGPRAYHRMEARLAVQLVRWLSGRHGVRHVRLTGGEPLLYPGLIDLVGALAGLGTLEELTLTTNGQALSRQARRLRQAGLSRVNVSLDTLDPERFARLTCGGDVGRTLRGIEAAVEAGLKPVRLNVVVQRGLNEDEIPRIAGWGLARGCAVRFLEAMPVGVMAGALHDRFFPASETLARLAQRFILRPIAAAPGQPATDYEALSRDSGELRGVIGVIASTTHPFCACCRRLRITSRAEIMSCLFDTGGSSLMGAWDGRVLDETAADRILQAAVMAKPQMGRRVQTTSMMAIGG